MNNYRNFIIFCIVALVAVGAFVMHTWNSETSLDNLERDDRLSLKKNIVVLGVDERPEEQDVGRSDTLFVVMFDPQKNNASLLSIPRDTRVHIPKHGWDKINHAYAYGGRELTQKTTEELLGIKVSNYIQVDFKGFTGLVDAIGGVDIDVEKEMYYYDSWDGFKIDIPKGRQHLDGKKAIQYVRYRDEEGDIGRIRRQQQFMMAVYEKIRSADMLLRIPGLAKQLTSMIKTDLPMSDMVSIGRALHTMVKDKGLVMATVPGTPRYIDEISYWQPDITDLRALMVDMQGAQMSERYKTAAELMEKEYDSALEKAVAGDKSEELSEKDKDDKKKTDEKDAKVKDADKKADAKDIKDVKTDSKKAKKQTAIERVNGEIVVRLVNCSGSKTAAEEATQALRNAGFKVQAGGTGDLRAQTKVVATTNNGSVVGKLSSVPFTHSLSIKRDASATVDGIIYLGADFK